MNPQVRKSHIRFSIGQNPVEVLIKRIGKVRSGGGFEDVKTELGPFTVRIFVDGSQTTTESGTIGTKEVSRVYSLLADDAADIQASPDIRDSFDAGSLGYFEVTAVFPQMVGGQICGYQAELERVK